ncbi:MAG: GspE/PulE family protein [Candidatus Portnoybacteria bacterium]|nr:GspE/PulE family protein [Candidatus Portnoybacteria bacterium]
MPTQKNLKVSEKIEQIHRDQEEQEAERSAKKKNLPYLNLQIFPINADVLSTIPRLEAQEGEIVVLKRNNKDITVGLVDPENKTTLAKISQLEHMGLSVTKTIISASSLKRALNFYQSAAKEAPLVGKIRIEQENLEQFNQRIKKVSELKDTFNSISTTELLETIIAGALKAEAGDIHIEPANEIRLRYRIDGVLQNISSFPLRAYQALLTRIKILSDMKINVHDTSQDGRFTIQIVKKQNQQIEIIKEIEARISILPEAENETIVIRLLGIGVQKLSIENLGLESKLLETIKHAIKKPNGLILNTGPTGSGKTTTLYAFLNYLNDPKVKIITIEDPVEYRIPGIVQTQVSQKDTSSSRPIMIASGQLQATTQEKYSFAQALRAILRQNPNVIMVGEIRDEETAKVAIQSSLTGHLVVSTLHANDATASVQRLFNFGIGPGDLALAMNFFMAQRLVRRLCPKCKKPYHPEKKVLDAIKENLKGLAIEKNLDNLEFFQPGSCDECQGLGYRGQIAIYEVFFKDEKIQELIAKNTQTLEIEKAAKAAGMVTLRQDGLLKAVDGITSIEEIERVTGELSETEI